VVKRSRSFWVLRHGVVLMLCVWTSRLVSHLIECRLLKGGADQHQQITSTASRSLLSLKHSRHLREVCSSLLTTANFRNLFAKSALHFAAAECSRADDSFHRVWAMRDGHLEASGHNWVEGQGSGPRIDKKDGQNEDQYDAMGNKIDGKKAKKLTSNEARKVSSWLFLTFVVRWDSLSFFHRPRRIGWHERRRARLSLTTSCESLRHFTLGQLIYHFLSVTGMT
jgi:hypothetical protein